VNKFTPLDAFFLLVLNAHSIFSSKHQVRPNSRSKYELILALVMLLHITQILHEGGRTGTSSAAMLLSTSQWIVP
jgi:hypothetical protein